MINLAALRREQQDRDAAGCRQDAADLREVRRSDLRWMLVGVALTAVGAAALLAALLVDWEAWVG